MAAFRHAVLLENIRLRSKVRNYDKKDDVNTHLMNITSNIGTPKIVAHLKNLYLISEKYFRRTIMFLLKHLVKAPML